MMMVSSEFEGLGRSSTGVPLLKSLETRCRNSYLLAAMKMQAYEEETIL